MPGDRRARWIPAAALIGAVAGAALVLFPAGSPSNPDVLVQLEPARAAAAVPLLRRAGAALVSRRLAIWRLSNGRAAQLLPVLGRDGLLRAAEPDRRIAPAGHATSSAVSSAWWNTAVGADRAQPPGPGRPVTVIDTGIDLAQPAFAERPHTTALDQQTTTGPDEGHGTMVSSVVVAVYPQVDLRVWDGTAAAGELSVSSVIQGLEAAAAGGPGVVNMSFGFFDRDPLVEQAIDVAFRSGVILVASAGNDRGSGSRDAYPGGLPHVLTVGATDERGSPTGFSSAVPGLDLVAPGKDIPVASPAGRTTADGTSFAAPIVAAATAWVSTARPRLDQTQVFELMRLSARDVGAPGFDPDTGFGLLDIPRALRMTAPPPDPGEPNEDIFLVRPDGLFSAGEPPLTSAGIRARLDFSEDPEDVYPLVVPGRSAVTVTLRADANADLELWRSGARTVSELGAVRSRDLLGTSTRPGRTPDSVTIVNERSTSATVYADVFPAEGVRACRYTLTVTRSALRRRP